MTKNTGIFGHHPEPDFDFAIEADDLQGVAYDVIVGLASQWPFWGRLSRALRVGRKNAWFGRPDLEPFLRNLERAVVEGDRERVVALTEVRTDA
jgi:hypothetical protein